MRALHPSTVLTPATALTAILAAALLTGCGEPAASPAPEPTAAAPTATAPPTAPTATTIDITVRDGRITPRPGRITVKRGERVRITVTSDTADEFHLHGYDRTLTLRPGTLATLELTCDLPGVFEAELHHSGARMFELQVG